MWSAPWQVQAVHEWGTVFDAGSSCAGTLSWQLPVPNGEYSIEVWPESPHGRAVMPPDAQVTFPRGEHAGCVVQGASVPSDAVAWGGEYCLNGRVIAAMQCCMNASMFPLRVVRRLVCWTFVILGREVCMDHQRLLSLHTVHTHTSYRSECGSCGLRSAPPQTGVHHLKGRAQ